MGKANELVIVLGIGTKSADRNCHTAFNIAVESGLRTVFFFEVVQELLGSMGKLGAQHLHEGTSKAALWTPSPAVSPADFLPRLQARLFWQMESWSYHC